MIRRSPTRIDLRLDDLQEYETLRKEREEKKDNDRHQASGNSVNWGAKLTQNEIQERIGYISHNAQTINARSNLTL